SQKLRNLQANNQHLTLQRAPFRPEKTLPEPDPEDQPPTIPPRNQAPARVLPSTVTRTVTMLEIPKAVDPHDTEELFCEEIHPANRPEQARICNPGGGPRRLVSHARRAATQQLLKNADQPVLREKSDISPRNVPDNETTPQGF